MSEENEKKKNNEKDDRKVIEKRTATGSYRIVYDPDESNSILKERIARAKKMKRKPVLERL